MASIRSPSFRTCGVLGTLILIALHALTGCETSSIDPTTSLEIQVPSEESIGLGTATIEIVHRTTDNFQNGSSAIDVYIPTAPQTEFPMPVVILLQGARVHKSYYSNYCARIAAHGFVVLAANHDSTLGYFTATSSVDEVLAYLEAESDEPDGRLFGVVDMTRLGIVGHSFGGATVLTLAQGDCNFPFCPVPFEKPASLRAIAVYGSHLADLAGDVISIDARGLAIQMMFGDLDSVADPYDTRRMFEAGRNGAKQLIALKGANHFAITDINNPPGTIADSNSPLIKQQASIALAADWVGMFMRAHVAGDADAISYLQASGTQESEQFYTSYTPFQIQPTPQANVTDFADRETASP